MQGLRYILLASIGILLVITAFVIQPKHYDSALDTVGVVAHASDAKSSAVKRNPNQAGWRVEPWNKTPVRPRDETITEVKPVNDILNGIKDFWDPKYPTVQANQETNHASVLKAVDDIQKYANEHENNNAAQYYAAISEIVKPSKALFWRVGGIVMKSEHIYIGIVGSLKSFIYNRHLYSRLVKRGFDYLTVPDDTDQRFTSIAELQNFAETVWLPALQRGMDRLHSLNEKSKSTGEFEFAYDRTIAAGGDPRIHVKDRYLRFIRPYLAATLFYAKNAEGVAKAFISYNFEEMPSYLNKLLRRTFLTFDKKPSEWFKKDGKNVHINTHKDYTELLGETKALYALREGHDLRGQSLAAFQKAQEYNLEWISQMRAYAELGEQEQFIVDAKELINLEGQKNEDYEKLARAIAGREDWIDPLSGKPITTDFPALFSLPNRLTYYFPKNWVRGDEQIMRKVKGRADLRFFFYEMGRGTEWNDPSIGGFLPGVGSSAQLFEAHRILSYSQEGDVLGNTILPFFM